jgi:hypothetical protein
VLHHNRSSNLLLSLPLLHLRRRAIQALALPFCLAIKYPLVILRSFCGNACIQACLQPSIALCFCGIPPAMFAPSRALIAIASCSCAIPPAMLAFSQATCHCCQAAIVVRLPLSLGFHCCWAAIVIRLPSLSGCHHCRAAIAAPFPRATSKRPIFVGLLVALFSWAAFECPVHCHWAVIVALFHLVRPIVCIPG